MKETGRARVLGIDLGTKRIGVATSDVTQTLASPYQVLERRGNRTADHRAIASIASEVEAERVIVGLPISLDGSEGPAARLVREEVAQMLAVLPLPVEVFDERFSTVTANRALIEGKVRASARRRVVDKVAAAVMLQHWLDAGVLRRARS